MTPPPHHHPRLTSSDGQKLLDVDPEDRQLLPHALAVAWLQVPLQVDEEAVEFLFIVVFVLVCVMVRVG